MNSILVSIRVVPLPTDHDNLTVSTEAPYLRGGVIFHGCFYTAEFVKEMAILELNNRHFQLKRSIVYLFCVSRFIFDYHSSVCFKAHLVCVAVITRWLYNGVHCVSRLGY